MAKTFTDVSGITVEIDDSDTSVHTNQDIVTGEVSDYLIDVRGVTYKVDKKVYDAVKEYLE